jgi:homoserine acetyltransferase
LWLSLFAYSADFQNPIIKPDNFSQFLDELKEVDLNINDYCSQIKAIQSHDVISKNGGSFEQIASIAKADLLVIEEMKDLICNPNTSIDFVNIVGGQIHKLSSPCGHISFICEAGLYSDLVRKFFND